MPRVELRGIAKVFAGGIAAVGPVDLDVEDGSLFVIVGPSGSGKTTLLRLIAGLETPTAGSLFIDGRRADRLSPRDRDLAMIFQNPVVYPYLSVFENLAFGLRARGAARGEIERRVRETAGMLGLGELLARAPAALSGGERQRVALGRALVRRPRVLLLDEPFSSLDAPLRAAIRAELVALHGRLGTTMIHVTHDQAEAIGLGSRVAVLKEGRIVQNDAPLDLYDRPANRFVAEFIGSCPMNIVPCIVESDPAGAPLRLRVVGLLAETAWTLAGDEPWAAGLRQRGSGRIDLGLRAEHIHIHAGEGSHQPGLPAQGTIEQLEPRGDETIALVKLAAHHLRVRLAPRAAVGVGTTLALALDPRAIVWFDPDSGLALH